MFSNILSVCNPLRVSLSRVLVAQFAAKAPSGGAGTAVGKKRFRIPVETDPHKLMKTCSGANYYKEGGEIELKDDSEYPEWLWELSLKPRKLHEYDPNTKEYWEFAKVVGQQREWKLRKITKNNQMIVNETILKKLELAHRRRFRALAKYHYNAGSDVVTHTQREDTWNTHLKDQFRVPANPKPFYPGMDKINLPNSVANMTIFRNKKKIGRYGL